MLAILSQLAPQTPWWMTEFRSYSVQHALVVLVVGVAVAGSIVCARRWRSQYPHRERVMRWIWAMGVIPVQLWSIVFWMLPKNFTWGTSLPLHVCDLIVWIVPIALLTEFRWSKALLYYIGVGLSILAFVTPVLDQGVATWHFWLFWLGHTQIVGSAVYLCAVMRYLPTWRDLLLTLSMCAIYIVMIIPVDVIWNFNYGYVGPLDKPEIVAELGPWPWRVVGMLVLVVIAFILLWLPWALIARNSATKQRAESLSVNVSTRDNHPDA